MIRRENYLKQITPFIGAPMIKVITGIRRSGKSTLLAQIIEKIKSSEVADNQILYINKELFEFDAIKNYINLHEFVQNNLDFKSKKCYLFVDEVQEIDQWERAINSLLASNKIDIYITGSNASLMSSELATLLSGRYVEFRILPMSYKEFRALLLHRGRQQELKNSFTLYQRYGGFPGLHHIEWEDSIVRQYLQSLYSTVLLKDVIVRNSIRDAALLEKIAEYIVDNAGNITTANSISQFLKSQQRKASVETVQSYIQHFINGEVIRKVKRFDIKGKRLLETFEKYYMTDHGFRFALLGYSPQDISGQLENIVLLELLHRGYMVNIGKAGEFEVDFVAQRGDERLYLQVCSWLKSDKTIDREYRSLEQINDHFPKLVLSLDKGFDTNRKGIMWKNIEDFLLMD
ncbi:ATP-binding protein [Perlabentimonas gracilis]|uniref:ATP-binding protein n=1 Tax=Perlabentimonas gracilis TaxID=2715279 RepID=UPI00140868D9|nr:ATP-binding protein [Perlabentimonas gracilis]NHB68917.1 ATP-binding protein [Perlabentimonas gracilis]